MSKFDEKIEVLQEKMYLENQERWNAVLKYRLQTRTKGQTIASLLSATALALPTQNKTAWKTLQNN